MRRWEEVDCENSCDCFGSGCGKYSYYDKDFQVHWSLCFCMTKEEYCEIRNIPYQQELQFD